MNLFLFVHFKISQPFLKICYLKKLLKTTIPSIIKFKTIQLILPICSAIQDLIHITNQLSNQSSIGQTYEGEPYLRNMG